MKSRDWLVALSVATLLTAGSPPVCAYEAFPVITDPNADGVMFGGTNIWADSPFQFDDTAISGGNDFLVYSWGGTSASTGAGFSVFVSNGENGIDMSLDGAFNEIESNY